MSQSSGNDEKVSLENLEPVCAFITRSTMRRPEKETIERAVEALLVKIRVIRTPNPYVWILLGRWKPETKTDEERISKLTRNLRSIEGTGFVSVSQSWTNLIKYQELAWKAWRNINS